MPTAASRRRVTPAILVGEEATFWRVRSFWYVDIADTRMSPGAAASSAEASVLLGEEQRVVAAALRKLPRLVITGQVPESGLSLYDALWTSPSGSTFIGEWAVG